MDINYGINYDAVIMSLNDGTIKSNKLLGRLLWFCYYLAINGEKWWAVTIIGKSAVMIDLVRITDHTTDKKSVKIINSGTIQEEPIVCCSDNVPPIYCNDDSPVNWKC